MDTTKKNSKNTRKQQIENQRKDQADKTKEIEKLWSRGNRSAMEEDIMSASKK